MLSARVVTVPLISEDRTKIIISRAYKKNNVYSLESPLGSLRVFRLGHRLLLTSFICLCAIIRKCYHYVLFNSEVSSGVFWPCHASLLTNCDGSSRECTTVLFFSIRIQACLMIRVGIGVIVWIDVGLYSVTRDASSGGSLKSPIDLL